MLIIYDDFFLKHDTGSFHPENPSRLTAIKNLLFNSRLKDKLSLLKPVPSAINNIALVHTEDYIKKIDNFSRTRKTFYLDPDTVLSPDSYECALLAAGACIDGIDFFFKEKGTVPKKRPENDFSNDSKNKFFFALVRPPGHHAFSNRGSGFCIFNNIAIAAKYAAGRYNLKRIAIIDFDVHHGNGTQEIFYEDKSVFYVSIHQYPHYPGSGYWTENGSKEGSGFNMNIPVTPFSGEIDYLSAFSELIFPVLKDYNPELILVSAGFDAHNEDSLSSINLRDETFYKLMKIIIFLSHVCGSLQENNIQCCTGIILEGGYQERAVSASALKVVEACLEGSGSGNHSNSFYLRKDGFKYLMQSLLPDCQTHLHANNANRETFQNIKKLFGIKCDNL